jgi:hypothetical protein
MSAPHVTGAAALVLQMHPGWSPEQVKVALRAQADLDARTGTIDKTAGSAAWGWGKLDVLSSVPVSLLSVEVVGVTTGQTIPAQLDGREVNLTGGLNYLVGDLASLHELHIQPVIEVGAGIQYKASETTFKWSGEAPVTVNFVTQFYVDVISQYGAVKGSGWYDANTIAKISAEGSVPLSGLSGLLGGRRVFSGWTGNATGRNPQLEFNVTSPMTVNAQWRDDLTLPYLLSVGLPILVVAGLLISRSRTELGTSLSTVISKVKVLRRSEPPQYCTNCGSPLAPGSEFCHMCGQKLTSNSS